MQTTLHHYQKQLWDGGWWLHPSISNIGNAEAVTDGPGCMREKTKVRAGTGIQTNLKLDLKFIDRPIPKPGPNELVVRNHAVAANPIDWKIQDYGYEVDTYPTVLGSDSCGVVVAIGEGVTKFKVGDRVTGFAGVIYNNDINHGAWQTYTVLRDIATTQIPDNMSFEEGSVFPMAMATSVIALHSQESGLLIWGASSSVGISALQLARNLGFKVFATASPTHYQTLKSLGAFEVFDYHDSSVVDKIVAAAKSAGAPISLGFDTITEGTTVKQAADVLAASGGKGGKLVLVLEWPEGEKVDSIEVSQTGATRTGRDQVELGKWFFNEYLEKSLANGSIVSAPKIEVVAGGIKAAQGVFDKLKAGVSGKKLVVTVD
ncbi:GroES-like protein [Hyaloscypha variabilis F]|uniref:GroES-like protein n=1 Tax=Hyaloscypha variabilis (strain UAMH 11265 / GT02V1 / F) TaxID=1149755 RepID=A0A2J6S4J9_HYAVF|nr:GroES-like protein [Hyaloscypha variabilis F]